MSSLVSFLRCRLGFHAWPQNATTIWVWKPRLTCNEFGTAMEYRACERCGKLGDVSTWLDVPDPDYGFPKRVGPFTAGRMREVMAGPRVALTAPPLPWEEDGTVKR